MVLMDYVHKAKEQITIIGTNPLIPELEKSSSLLADLLTLNDKLKLTVFYESDSENFGQSLLLDSQAAETRMTYSTLTVHRNRISGTKKDKKLIGGLRNDILSKLDDDELKKDVGDRVALRQVNLRLPVNIIQVDDKLWACVTTPNAPTLNSYDEISSETQMGVSLLQLIDFYRNDTTGGVFLSEPGEELIQLYDRAGYPRGIFPRQCFYTTAFQRYSVWGFIFNREGQLLLQQRSLTAKDGRGLWDKSIGGHVDLLDSSTYITAQRELVEELFLPEAEFTKYVRADLGEIENFGDWHPTKRMEQSFTEAFKGLGPADWIMFRASDEQTGDPLTVTRRSQRRIHDDEGNVTMKPTVFRSDVYLFVAPEGFIDTPEQVKSVLQLAEEKGAAQDHKILTLEELRSWIEDEEREGKAEEIFTDDLLHINMEYRGMLESFAEFIRYIG